MTELQLVLAYWALAVCAIGSIATAIIGLFVARRSKKHRVQIKIAEGGVVEVAVDGVGGQQLSEIIAEALEGSEFTTEPEATI